MSLSGNQWVWLDQDHDKAAALGLSLDLPVALARLLINRGAADPALARAFLYPSAEQFHSPWLMMGMEEAVDRLMVAMRRKEKIIVHGDYDADGIAAAVIMVEALRQLGADVDYFLPSRFEEGYGLHLEPLTQFKESGASLVITVDCGINAAEEIDYAARMGLDMIITDHHQPLGTIGGAVSVVNPLQVGCLYPFKELSGAGIAFKLACALLEKAGLSFPDHLLDLAALGTAADVVPLLDENRIIVAKGLEVIRSLERTGFKALAEAVSLERERINGTTLAFALAPAVNAAGRMGEALPAAELLLAKDLSRAEELAGHLHRANSLRRATEQKILAEAEEAALGLTVDKNNKIITLAGENWHHGVIGIVASRLVEKFNRPVVLIALEEGEGRGSARSITGFNITAALSNCASILERFGGHEQAAGFAVLPEKVPVLRESLNRYARENLTDERLNARIYLETELEESEITFDLAARLDQLQPFGTANPAPLFGSRGWEIVSWRLVGADKSHLKLTVRKGGRTLAPIVFSGACLEPRLEKGRPADLAFRLKRGYFRDRETVEVEVKDISYSDSFACGRLELIDRRNHENRLRCLKTILDREEVKAVLFASTLSRAQKIKESCPAANHPCFVTGGKANENRELPAEFNTLVLFDLPLHEGILKPIFKKGFKQESLAVHLLYSREDQEQNRRLADLSLPSQGQLEILLSALLEVQEAEAGLRFPGKAEKILDITPAPSYWERAEKIFTEIGMLEKGLLSPKGPELKKKWPECLQSSPTYLAAAELRKSCERFQQLFLEGTLEEVALFLQKLTGGR